MDWQQRLQGLLNETQHNLRACAPARRRNSAPAGAAPRLTSPTKIGAGSYAVLRQGVSPGDPHLIAPASDCEYGTGAADALIPPRWRAPAPSSPGPRPFSPLSPAGENTRADRLRAKLGGLGEQLRAAAAGWQDVAAVVAGVEGSSAAQASQLTALSAGLADLRAAQGRLEAASAEQWREVKGQLTALGGRLGGVVAMQPDGTQNGGPSSTGGGQPAAARQAAELAALLQRAEAALAGLQARADRHADAPPATMPPAELASVREQLAALQAAAASHADRHDAQQAELGQLGAALQAEQRGRSAAAREAAATQARLAAQLSALERAAAGGTASTHQLSARVEQLATQLAAVGAQLEEQRAAQQQAGHGPALAGQPAVGAVEFERLAAEVRAGSEQLGRLQDQATRLATLEAGLEDANQRLFELRVEAQNGAEDGAIAASSTKRAAEAAELQAAEAAEAADAARQLAAGLQADLQHLQHQVAALAERQGQRSDGSSDTLPAALAALVQQAVAAEVQQAVAALQLSAASQPADGARAAAKAEALSTTVDELAAELAAVKLAMAQQQEAAESLAVAARAEGTAVQQQCMRAALTAIDQRLLRHRTSSQAEADAAVEAAASLNSLNDLVVKQRDELAAVKESLAAVRREVAAAAMAAAAPAASQADTSLARLETAVAVLQAQAEAAAQAAQQRTAAHAAELAGLQQQVATAQAALRLDVAAMQRHLAAVEDSSESRSSEFHPALAAVQQRLAELEAALVAQQRQQAQQAQRRSEEGGACGERPEGLAVVQREMVRMQRELSALAAVAAVNAELRATQQQQQQQQPEGAAAQLAALAARLDKLEAAFVSGSAPQQQVQQVQEQAPLSPRASPRSYSPLSRESSSQRKQEQPPGPSALIRQRSSSLSQQAEAAAAAAATAAHQRPSSGNLFARIGRSLSGNGRRSSSGAAGAAEGTTSAGEVQPAADISEQQPAVVASASLAPEASRQASEAAPVQTALWGGLEGESSSEGLSGSTPRRYGASRRTSTGNTGGASAATTPRGSAGKFTPRSRYWAGLQQERSAAGASAGGGGGSAASTPRREPSAFSSFGDLPLPSGGSASLLSPRDDLE